MDIENAKSSLDIYRVRFIITFFDESMASFQALKRLIMLTGYMLNICALASLAHNNIHVFANFSLLHNVKARARLERKR